MGVHLQDNLYLVCLLSYTTTRELNKTKIGSISWDVAKFVV